MLSATCDEGWTLKDTGWNFKPFAIAPDRTFGGDFSDSGDGYSLTGAINGAFDATSGNASGTMHVDFLFTTSKGPVHCRTGDVSWTALKQ